MKVISGGQVGVDIAALRAAKKVGVETGGWMPYGWETLDGPKPEYEQEYGMKEYKVRGYPERTKQNVISSDGTLRIATNWNSYGELATAKAINLYGKPSYDIDAAAIFLPLQIFMVMDWIKDNDIQILNVAGNARRSLEKHVEMFIEKLLLNIGR